MLKEPDKSCILLEEPTVYMLKSGKEQDAMNISSTLQLSQLKLYDSSMDYDMSMYDKLPYDRDLALCNADAIALESGNVLKYYRCAIKQDDYYVINNKDKEFVKELESLRKQLSARQEFLENKDGIEHAPELSDQQIDQLFSNEE